jgi:hypothetical protein
MIRYRGTHIFDSIQAKFISGIPMSVMGNQYFVSANDGDDANPGTSPDKPVKTIGRARALSNATIDWGKYQKKFNVIWIEPAPTEAYDESFAGGFYCAFVIGLGDRHQVMIRPSATYGPFKTNATSIDAVFMNLHFQSLVQDVPICDLGVCNYTKFLGCKFSIGAAVTGVVAIDTENSDSLWVEDCDFTSGQVQNIDTAIFNRGGANKYAHNVRYLNNRISAKSYGIRIAGDCTASQAIIKDNLLLIDGTGIGIDGNPGGADTGCQGHVVDNEIIIAGAGDAIHGFAAGKKLYNKTIVNGTFAYETALA